MTKIVGDIFTKSDLVQMKSLGFRQTRNDVATANIANSEVPGYRALGYDFEEQLASVMDQDDPFPLKVSHPGHMKNDYAGADGKVQPEVFVRPTETIPEDGNTVDVDREMSELSQNQILYRSAVELINRKIAILKYAISSGGR